MAPAPPGEETGRAELLAFLARPESYGLPPGTAVEQVTTHAARVFLAGERAFKIKRVVRYSFLDFSTLAQRKTALEAELRLNRRTAPALYRRLAAITRAGDGTLAFDGPGTTVEWALELRRFDREQQFDRLAASGRLTRAEVEALVDSVLAFHAAAEVRGDPYGGAAALAALIAENDEDLRAWPELFAPTRVAALREASRAALADSAALLDRRREAGCVRHCHGDLHLGNIVLWQGRPTPFDCIEFSERLASIDVLYDFAFLLMDLDLRAARGLAPAAMARYFGRAGGVEALAALPLMLSLRAAIRAKVTAAALPAQDDPAAARALAGEAEALFDAAERYLKPCPARLVAVGGLSGSGKSTLARALAAGIGRAPGALLLRSDVLRKRLMGVPPEARLPEAAYAPAVNERVYETLYAEARQALLAGQSVIADAVWARPAERARLAALAADCGAGFAGLWLEAPAEVLKARVAGRRDDASDAGVAVLERQLGYDLGEIAWRRLDVAGPPEAVARQAGDWLEVGV